VGIGGLFSELFPNEHFDIFSSVNRLYQLIFRTRRWLADNGLEASVIELDGVYSFEVIANFGVRVPNERDEVPRELGDLRLNELRAQVGDSYFSSRDACRLLGISPSSFKILIAWGLARGTVVKIGSGRSTRYHFAGSADPILNAA